MVPPEMLKTFESQDGKKVRLQLIHVESIWEVQDGIVDVVMNSGHRIRVRWELDFDMFFVPETLYHVGEDGEVVGNPPPGDEALDGEVLDPVGSTH